MLLRHPIGPIFLRYHIFSLVKQYSLKIIQQPSPLSIFGEKAPDTTGDPVFEGDFGEAVALQSLLFFFRQRPGRAIMVFAGVATAAEEQERAARGDKV